MIRNNDLKEFIYPLYYSISTAIATALPHTIQGGIGKGDALPHTMQGGNGKSEALPHTTQGGNGKSEALPHTMDKGCIGKGLYWQRAVVASLVLH